ncbi:IclR family transcriptional regulator [Phytoactinopolyspora halotolerans]|uniref:IclR family transcriptional regulator n=1 Tax=Phytoactinopolyspora halotolerans TaxID=1981512 RepID=A0A6L9SGB9_9ACTN|nr:IclR family transcriptional regulator [Phytoactinopolyspora halotolerans]NEE04415.1 IclR family transcriptional regulator [Phytoactinopolyspora halotolerans]
MKNAGRPPYPLASVDNALRLILLLRESELGVRDAADALGVARSTAHRLLAMLVYRGFAEQSGDRRYRLGPVLTGAERASGLPARYAQLRWVARPHMNALAARVRETVNLAVLAGSQVRFIDSVESTQMLHIGSRTGMSLPAARTSGGKALLAEMSDDDVRARFETAADAVDVDALLGELRDVRRRGYGLNFEETEPGVRAVAVAVHAGDRAVGALAVAAPAQRLTHRAIKSLVPELTGAAARVDEELTHWGL